MSTTTLPSATAGHKLQPEQSSRSLWTWARVNLFNSWPSTAVTLVLGYLILRLAVGIVEWGFLNAIWSVPTRGFQLTLNPSSLLSAAPSLCSSPTSGTAMC